MREAKRKKIGERATAFSVELRSFPLGKVRVEFVLNVISINVLSQCCSY